MKKMLRCLPGLSLGLVLLSFVLPASAQLTKRPNVAINSNVNGYLEYLPQGYAANPTERYPLILFINGLNSQGDGTEAGLENHFTGSGAPHDQQRGGTWQDAYTVNGQTYRFIIITPQFVTNFNTRVPTPSEVNDVINYAIANYRIDTTRMYIMGHSTGGGPVWEYTGASSAYAKRIAAILPFGGVSFPTEQRANIIRNGSVAVWAFHNMNDQLVPVSFTQDYINMIRNGAPPLAETKATYPISAFSPFHDVWQGPYTRSYTEEGKNIYEWMLQFSKPASRAFAGDDREITAPSNVATLNGSGTGPNGTAASFSWQQVSGPSTSTISAPSSATTQVSSLVPGRYIFRLTVTDNGGGTAIDDVAVMVYPTTVRIEAENYTAMQGVQVVPANGGTPSYVGFIDNGDWMEYSVNVPASGNYKVRYQIAAFPDGGRIEVRNSGGTVLSVVNVIRSGGWETFWTYVDTLPLVAGTQTIRLQSTNGQGWNIDWLEVVTGTQVVLPVNFTLFNASCSGGVVNLTWRTSGEQNSRGFAVERSQDGSNWTTLGTLPSRGGSQQYSFRDEQAPGAAQYRIVETGIDGRKTYSSILRSSCGERAAISLFPNPARNETTLSLGLPAAARVQVSLINAGGAVVRQLAASLPSGTSQLPISLQGLPAGSYTLRAQWGNEVQHLRFLKQ